MKTSLINYWKKNKIITNKDVLDAFRHVQRENFVRSYDRKYAYSDIPLSIGYGQTISQPTTVMIMTQALKLKKGNNVLEIGAGSGYQAAIISYIIGSSGHLTALEIIPELAAFAKQNLKKSGIKNTEIINADGSMGYEKNAPYDRCIITAACPKIPQPLLRQLNEGAILVAPVESGFYQELVQITKTSKGLKKQYLGTFSFVPLRGKYGYK